MPAGIANPVAGYATFCVIKFAGYSLAARLISKYYGRTDVRSVVVGGTRTLIGMAAGAAYLGLWMTAQFVLSQPAGSAIHQTWPAIYLAGLLPVRIAEWWLLIWIFYDRGLKDRARGWRTVGLGTIWSYILDIPAIAGFIATAGFWVC